MSLFDNIINTVIGEARQSFFNTNDKSSNSLVLGILSMLSNKNSESSLVVDLMTQFGLNGGVLERISNLFGGNKDSENHHLEHLNEFGGLSGLKILLEQNGLAAEVNSWISTGQNLPVSPEQLEKVLDSNGALTELAQNAHVDKEEASKLLSNILPRLIDKITPNGIIPENGFDFTSLVKQFIKL